MIWRRLLRLSSMSAAGAIRDEDKTRESHKASPPTVLVSQVEDDIKAAERTIK